MTQIQTQVVSVAARTTRNGKTLYDITLADGQKYTAFDPLLAQKAASLANQPVVADVEVKQNGQYTNHNINGIYAQGEAVPAAPVSAPVVPFTPGVGVAITPAPSGGGGGGMSPEAVARITRLSALSSATGIIAQLYSGAGDGVEPGTLVGRSIALAEAFVKYAYEGTGPAGQVVTPPLPTDGTPQGIAQAVTAAAQGAVVQVGAPVGQNVGGPQGDGIPWT